MPERPWDSADAYAACTPIRFGYRAGLRIRMTELTG
jgi:hypothetical protein